jgi:hypothetical protein
MAPICELGTPVGISVKEESAREIDARRRTTAAWPNFPVKNTHIDRFVAFCLLGGIEIRRGRDYQ